MNNTKIRLPEVENDINITNSSTKLIPKSIEISGSVKKKSNTVFNDQLISSKNLFNYAKNIHSSSQAQTSQKSSQNTLSIDNQLQQYNTEFNNFQRQLSNQHFQPKFNDTENLAYNQFNNDYHNNDYNPQLHTFADFSYNQPNNFNIVNNSFNSFSNNIAPNNMNQLSAEQTQVSLAANDPTTEDDITAIFELFNQKENQLNFLDENITTSSSIDEIGSNVEENLPFPWPSGEKINEEENKDKKDCEEINDVKSLKSNNFEEVSKQSSTECSLKDNDNEKLKQVKNYIENSIQASYLNTSFAPAANASVTCTQHLANNYHLLGNSNQDKSNSNADNLIYNNSIPANNMNQSYNSFRSDLNVYNQPYNMYHQQNNIDMTGRFNFNEDYSFKSSLFQKPTNYNDNDNSKMNTTPDFNTASSGDYFNSFSSIYHNYTQAMGMFNAPHNHTNYQNNSINYFNTNNYFNNDVVGNVGMESSVETDLNIINDIIKTKF